MRGRWVFTVKDNANGTETYKNRYEAKGYSEVTGLGYNTIFRPTANMASVHRLIQLAAQYDLDLQQTDVKTVHLLVPIDCEMYMYSSLKVSK